MNFEEWLKENMGTIVTMQVFSKLEIPTDAEEASGMLSQIYKHMETAGEFRAQVDSFLRQMRAHETLEVRKAFKELTSPERETMIEDRLDSVLRVRDLLRVLSSTLHDLSWSLSRVNR